MGALFNRIKTWKALENLTNSDLNAEFNNILTNFIPAKVDDYSASVSQMQETLSPGAVGTEVQATSLAEELKQLRYMVKSITGGAQWYTAPTASILELEAFIQTPVPDHRITSGRVDANNQPMFLVPHGTNPTVTLDCTPTNFVATINATPRTYSADLVITTLQTAPASNNTCAVNDAALAGAQATRHQGEWGTTITIGTIGTEISSRNGKYAAFLKGSEVFLAEIDTTNNVLKNCIRGYCFDNSDAWLARETVSNTNTITLLQATWIFATYESETAGLDVCYNRPYYGYDQPTSPSIGDYWFDYSADRWKKYSGVSWDAQEAMPIGFCAQSSTGCIAARSFDFYKQFSSVNTVELERVDNGSARSTKFQNRLSVYGNLWAWDSQHINYSMSTDLDTGTTDAASTVYYFYVKDTGDVSISLVRPHDRRNDILGAYHPAKPWRCIAQMANDGSSNLDATTLTHAGISLPLVPASFVETAMIGANQVTRPKLVSVGQQVSSSASDTETGSTYSDITSATITITTTGRPVLIFGQPAGAGGVNTGYIGWSDATNATSGAYFKLVRDSTDLAEWAFQSSVGGGTTQSTRFSPGQLLYLDHPAAGTYVYKYQFKNNAADTAVVDTIKIVAFEL